MHYCKESELEAVAYMKLFLRSCWKKIGRFSAFSTRSICCEDEIGWVGCINHCVILTGLFAMPGFAILWLHYIMYTLGSKRYRWKRLWNALFIMPGNNLLINDSLYFFLTHTYVKNGSSDPFSRRSTWVISAGCSFSAVPVFPWQDCFIWWNVDRVV